MTTIDVERRLHWIQHVPFEGLGCIEPWATHQGYRCTRTRLYDGENLPELDPIDMLVIMGGPMNIYQDSMFPWLTAEKGFIENAIDKRIPILGICLGAQLIADVLGGKVRKGEHAEIGWHDVQMSGDCTSASTVSVFPESFTPFHWHGDTFDLPSGSIHLASSAGCENQAFEYRENVVGLQFHLESTGSSIDSLITHCGDEIIGGRYIQSPGDIRQGNNGIGEANNLMKRLLNNMSGCNV
ncbi:MAG: type 1 glutamine amidotransferase [Kiritimatiellia bacterium]|jgi:GMP synthase (glutamine-hydrolysing)|nr:type 1 glutamine amidotransferase [Kiritimatiellia bacterium]